MANVYTPTINSVVTPTPRATDRHDVLTVCAVAVVVYALSSLLHEGVGHGGACLLARGVPRELSSMHFQCSLPDGTRNAERLVDAGGTIASLVGGLGALGLYQITKGAPLLRYAVWLFAAVNIMQATGYLLFSGVGNVGDWAAVIRDVEPHWLWRGMLILVGLASYWWSTLYLFRIIDPLIGEARPRRFEHALRLGGRAYLMGGLLAVLTGLFNPGGIELVLFSGAAASLGGTSGLAWGPQTLRGTRTPSSKLEKPVMIVRRNWGMICGAMVVGALFVIMMGPGFVWRGR